MNFKFSIRDSIMYKSSKGIVYNDLFNLNTKNFFFFSNFRNFFPGNS